MPRASANSATLPKMEIANFVFMDLLKHTLIDGVKHTLTHPKYDCAMSTLEERVLEAILATGLEVPELAEKVGVSAQTIYAWKKGIYVRKMKAEYLVELAGLSGYEPMWIMKGKGLKKKSLHLDQEKILQIAEHMENTAKQNWIAIGSSLVSATPATDKPQRIPGQLGSSIPADPHDLRHHQPDLLDQTKQSKEKKRK